MGVLIRIFSVLGASLLMFSFTNCSKVGFATRESALKAAAFDSGAGGAGEETTRDLSDGSGEETTRNPSGDPSPEQYPLATEAIDVSVPILRECSDNGTNGAGGTNVQLASNISMGIYLGDTKVCGDNHNYRADLINLASIRIQLNCDLIEGKTYEVRFSDASSNQKLGDFRIRKKDGVLSAKDSKVEILYATNPDNNNIANSALEEYSKCDKMSSPLVVKLTSSPLRLSSPLDGIKFNIRGERGGNVKNQISWPVDDSIGFIALPDKKGKVKDINQLFGDNTKGPDGQYAADGYAALAKHDLNRDGVIDKKDAVFSKLRIFIDLNRDGESQAGELTKLKSHGILSIDLAFDPHYAEHDLYGNQILFKSVAETKNGFLQVFDIWFRMVD